MTYRIKGLDPATFASLVGQKDETLAAAGACRMIADEAPGFPCRITLDDAKAGASLLLLNHVSNHGGPFHCSHAIFVSEGATSAATYDDCIPPALHRRPLSLRGFDASGFMTAAMLVEPGAGDTAIREMLADPAIDHIDAHYALRGCFAARVERQPSDRV